MIAPESALDVVRRSPDAVGRHDKSAWIRLFSDNFLVADPYGGTPVTDREALGRFWDTYIAPRRITFEIERPDIVVAGEVVRDVTIVIGDNSGVELRTPAHLHYRVTPDGTISRLAAHWEVGPALRQLAGLAPAKLRSLATTSVRLVRHQSLREMLGFAGAARSVGERGKAAVAAVVAAADVSDRDGSAGRITDVAKVVAAGDCVSLSCRVDGRQAVVFYYLDRGSLAIRDVTTYTG